VFQNAIAKCEKANIVLKFSGARQCMKARTGRCDGRKPYGATEDEQAIISRMKELRAPAMAFDPNTHSWQALAWFRRESNSETLCMK
jgi:hypothetical protein